MLTPFHFGKVWEFLLCALVRLLGNLSKKENKIVRRPYFHFQENPKQKDQKV